MHPVEVRESGRRGRSDAGSEAPHLNVEGVAGQIAQQLEPPHMESSRAPLDADAHIVGQRLYSQDRRQL
jgi:hypothetical protein